VKAAVGRSDGFGAETLNDSDTSIKPWPFSFPGALSKPHQHHFPWINPFPGVQRWSVLLRDAL
jgi:hypothetical protein